MSQPSLTERPTAGDRRARVLDDLMAAAPEAPPGAARPLDRKQLALALELADASGQADDFLPAAVEVAKICASMALDTETLCCALLADGARRRAELIQEVRDVLGEDVAALVNGTTQLSRLRYRSRAGMEAERYRNMIVTMARDIRVIIVRLAEDLLTMRTISEQPRPRQIEKAKETLGVYAPLAHRLGLHQLRRELEDLAFRTLHPRKYREIRELIAQQRAARERYVADAARDLRHALDAAGIAADVSGRSKNFYSVYSKMLRKSREFNEIYDVEALRVVTGSIKECYGAAGVIHAIWKPLHGRFKDRIATPDARIYQALHTTVIGPEGRSIEIQIRTREMDDAAAATHWLYKHGRGARRRNARNAKVELLRSMLVEATSTRTVGGTAKIKHADLSDDEVVVFSPTGEATSLPTGATPVDFAYRVHTDLGDYYAAATVNGSAAPPERELRTGDVVEIFASERQAPSAEWLESVKTERARDGVRRCLRAAKRDRDEAAGRALLVDALAETSTVPQEPEFSWALAAVCDEVRFRQADDLFVALGQSKIRAEIVAQKVGKALRRHERAKARARQRGTQSTAELQVVAAGGALPEVLRTLGNDGCFVLEARSGRAAREAPVCSRLLVESRGESAVRSAVKHLRSLELVFDAYAVDHR
jgi:GTP pyrophosphokinase